MTERLLYEEQLADQFNDLALPDINMAWADMKRRLEEDDDRRFLPFWLHGCAGWVLLGLLLAGLGWWIVRPEKWFDKKQDKPGIEINKTPVQNKNDTGVYLYDSAGSTYNKQPSIENDSNSVLTSLDQQDSLKKNDGNSRAKKSNEQIIVNETKKRVVKNKRNKDVIENGRVNKTTQKKNTRNIPVEKNDGNTGTSKTIKDTAANGVNKKYPSTDPLLVKDSPDLVNPDTANRVIKTITKIDSVQKQKQDSIVKRADKEEAAQQPKKDSAKKGSFSFSAGVGMHQQVPIDGQSFVMYNTLGRKGSFADYIPSVYFRLNRDDKWFIQTGFRYGAPQLVNELLFSSKTDTISVQKYNTTKNYLKKTFYHQLPLTFNYFIIPGWSMGTGVVWNKFAGAVSSQDIIQTDRFTGDDTVISENLIRSTRRPDSNFVKSWFQAVIETQYKWKRFSFGINYSFGLQPYIRFVLPNGQQQEERNSSLQLFIRYELWRSKKQKE